MANARTRRHNAEAVKGFLPPTQENVALMVAFHLKINVFAKRLLTAKVIHGNRMIDNEINWRQRINLLNVATKTQHGLSHRGQIDDGGYTGEILH